MSVPEPSAYHFTYRLPNSTDLEQGDLLSKEGLSQILAIVHPHYLGDEYTHFLVLTQSCDLVRRAGKCKTRYITLAAVRPVEIVLQREVEKYQDEFAKKGMVCSRNKRQLLENFLERLLNNNEPEYFFLRKEDAVGLHDDSCAFLRLSISIRAYQHYDSCLTARVVSLTPQFQAKLGWLVGNMYSRIGTEDWVPQYTTKEQFHSLITAILDQLCLWVDDAKLRRARTTASFSLDSYDTATIRSLIESAAVPSRRDRILECVETVLHELGLVTEEDILKKFRRRLINDPVFAASVK
ncbi:MAG TPA: hypothetical protein VFB33_02635 [Candidatus Binataceae bacterium]|nr:hypothetical protein [Candidatus Binataceae bacterium]